MNRKQPETDAAALCVHAAELAGQGRLDEAAESYRQATEADPDFAEAHYNLGVVLQLLGNAENAADAFRRAISIKPDYFQAHTNLGAALETMGNTEDAIVAYRLAIDANPSHARAFANLGGAWQKLKRPDDALVALEKALELESQFPEALNNMGNVLCDLGRFDDAIDHFQRALALMPDFKEAHHNLGNTHKKAGRMDDAATSLGRALEIDPDYAEAHWNLSHVLLLQGRLADGWGEHEWRWRCAEAPAQKRDFPQSSWPGPNANKDAGAKTVLVWGEQGVGDEILFSSMIPDLLDTNANVVIECDRRLVPLFQRSFPEAKCIAQVHPPSPESISGDIDYQTPSGSLGRWLRPDLASFPARTSYLMPDPERREAIREKYRDGETPLLVGISWSSINEYIGGEKSVSLADLGFLGKIPGIRLVDLQYGNTENQRRAFEETTGAAVNHDNDIDQMADLDGFAAQVAALDLVVGVSNTTAHMAGALGVETFVMLSAVPLSCWMLERDDSPWYPSIKLFRQGAPGDWSAVLKQVEAAVRARVTRQAS
ncbi:MAG: tetratricopeptide repeat protein [Rhodospirillales bacterium]|nr:tetratricopeptide repeat protein [Rhodospirillales bacterium]